MDKQKYNNYPLAISQILGLIEANDILSWKLVVRR